MQISRIGRGLDLAHGMFVEPLRSLTLICGNGIETRQGILSASEALASKRLKMFASLLLAKTTARPFLSNRARTVRSSLPRSQ